MAGTMYLQKFRMSKFDVFFSRVISAAENKQPRHRASGDSAQCFALQRDTNQQPRRERRGCCSHKVVAVGFNTLHYDASVGVLTLRTNKRYGYLRENT